MAEIVNKSQQVIKKGTSPKSAYSRVVSLSLALEPDLIWRHVVTPPLGNNIWLLSLRLWSSDRPYNAIEVTDFEVVTGVTSGETIQDVMVWEKVLPIWQQNRTPIYWTLWDRMPDLSWSIMQRWKGEGRRFGIFGRRNGLTAVTLYISYEISEG